MSRKFLMFALGAFMLVQSTHGNAIGTTTSAEAEEQKIDAAGFEFVNTTLIEMFSLIDKVFTSSRNAFEPIFAELATIGDTAENELQDKVIELKKLLSRMAKSEDDNVGENQPDKADFIEELGKILNSFKKTEEEAVSLTDFDKKVLKVEETVKADLEKDFVAFTDNIVTAAEKYWNSMSLKKQETDQKFHDAFTQLKNEPDIHKKGELLKNFLTFDDSSEESN